MKSEPEQTAHVKENITPVPSVLPLARLKILYKIYGTLPKNNGNITVGILYRKTKNLVIKILPIEDKKFN